MIKEVKEEVVADAAPAEVAAEAVPEAVKPTVLEAGPREHIPGEREPGGDLK